MTIPEPYDELVLKSLQQDITFAERSALDAWIGASPENSKLYHQYAALWKAAQPVPGHDNFQTSEEWEKLTQKIASPTHVVKMYPWRTMARVAAVVLLVIASSYFLQQFVLSKQRTEVVAENETRIISLPDGSTCLLEKGSSISYNNSFDGGRDVSLEGQGFFDVVRDPSKPFKVITKETTVTVLGTSFNVDARNTDSITTLYVVSGKVRLAQNDHAENLIDVVPGQFVIFSTTTATLSTALAENENLLAWKEHRLTFRSAPLAKVINTVQNYFGVKIDVKNPDLLRCKITSTFDRPTIEEVMETLQETLHLTISKTNDHYSINGNGCF